MGVRLLLMSILLEWVHQVPFDQGKRQKDRINLDGTLTRINILHSHSITMSFDSILLNILTKLFTSSNHVFI